MEKGITPRYTLTPPDTPFNTLARSRYRSRCRKEVEAEYIREKGKGNSAERCPARILHSEVIDILLNFDSFTRVVERVYDTVPTPYTLDNVLFVFRHFFQVYEAEIGEVHPSIRRDQIARIIKTMPYIDNQNHGKTADISPEDYLVLIDAYFQTYFPNCDYRINHFFSGQIRELRFYEQLY